NEAAADFQPTCCAPVSRIYVTHFGFVSSSGHATIGVQRRALLPRPFVNLQVLGIAVATMNPDGASVGRNTGLQWRGDSWARDRERARATLRQRRGGEPRRRKSSSR